MNIVKQRNLNNRKKYSILDSSPIFKKFLSTKNLTINSLDDLTKHYFNVHNADNTTTFIMYNSDFTWSFFSMSSHLGDLVVWESIKMAFDIWSSITNNRFIYAPGGKTDFNIGFLKPFHLTSTRRPCTNFGPNTLGHAYFPETHYAGEIHFNDEQFFLREKDEISYSLLHVAIHEIGHSLGLRHNNRSTSVMYPETSPNKHLFLNLKFFDTADINQFKKIRS